MRPGNAIQLEYQPPHDRFVIHMRESCYEALIGSSKFNSKEELPLVAIVTKGRHSGLTVAQLFQRGELKEGVVLVFIEQPEWDAYYKLVGGCKNHFLVGLPAQSVQRGPGWGSFLPTSHLLICAQLDSVPKLSWTSLPSEQAYLVLRW